MADCNIRNIDPDLMRRLKIAAARYGLSLRDWCITELRNAVNEVETVVAQEATTREANAALAQMRGEETDELFPEPGPAPEYVTRVSHALGCKCFICKPPK